MKSKITFCLLSESTLEACYRSICALTEKYYLNGKTIFIYTDSQNTAAQLDDLLWIFHDTSFLPHEIYFENSISKMPILLGVKQTKIPTTDILINLTTGIPKSYSQHKEIFEIVPNDETLKAKAREKYKYYKTQGEEILSTNVT